MDENLELNGQAEVLNTGVQFHTPDVVDYVPPQSKQVGTLFAGKDAKFVPREFLATIQTPEGTATHQPIGHDYLVNQIHESLSYRRLNVVREEYAVSKDGMRCFGLLELNVEYAGVNFAIGLRNSNDKSMKIGLVAGYKVTVCENRMLTGDFNPLSAKHSKNFNLVDALSVGLERIQRQVGKVEDEIELKKDFVLKDDQARNLFYRLFTDFKLPVSLFRTTHKEYFVKPTYPELAGKNLWSFENSLTTAFKMLEPVKQFEVTSKLGRFISQVIQSRQTPTPQLN